MDETRKLLSEMVRDLDKIADNSGIVKSILIGRMYASIQAVDRNLKTMEESWSKEKAQLEEEIQKLTEIGFSQTATAEKE